MNASVFQLALGEPSDYGKRMVSRSWDNYRFQSNRLKNYPWKNILDSNQGYEDVVNGAGADHPTVTYPKSLNASTLYSTPRRATRVVVVEAWNNLSAEFEPSLCS